MKYKPDFGMRQIKYWNRNSLSKRRKYSHPVIEAFVRSKLEVLFNSINFKQINNCLELGSGNGFFSYYLDKICNLTATDFSPKMIDLNPVENKLIMDASDITFSTNSFDIVFESCMLHHVDNVDIVIKEMVRVAKKFIIIIEPNRNNPFVFLFGLLKREERGLLKFSKKFLKQKIENNNLKIIAVLSHGVIMPNKTPKVLLPFFKAMDKEIPCLGFDNIFVCSKKEIS